MLEMISSKKPQDIQIFQTVKYVQHLLVLKLENI